MDRKKEHQRKSFRRKKLTLLEKTGLIGCLTGTGVTSKNYKDILYKKELKALGGTPERLP